MQFLDHSMVDNDESSSSMNESGINQLPAPLISRILQELALVERMNSRLVCQHWNDVIISNTQLALRINATEFNGSSDTAKAGFVLRKATKREAPQVVVPDTSLNEFIEQLPTALMTRVFEIELRIGSKCNNTTGLLAAIVNKISRPCKLDLTAEHLPLSVFTYNHKAGFTIADEFPELQLRRLSLVCAFPKDGNHRMLDYFRTDQLRNRLDHVQLALQSPDENGDDMLRFLVPRYPQTTDLLVKTKPGSGTPVTDDDDDSESGSEASDSVEDDDNETWYSFDGSQDDNSDESVSISQDSSDEGDNSSKDEEKEPAIAAASQPAWPMITQLTNLARFELTGSATAEIDLPELPAEAKLSALRMLVIRYVQLPTEDFFLHLPKLEFLRCGRCYHPDSIEFTRSDLKIIAAGIRRGHLKRLEIAKFMFCGLTNEISTELLRLVCKAVAENGNACPQLTRLRWGFSPVTLAANEDSNAMSLCKLLRELPAGSLAQRDLTLEIMVAGREDDDGRLLNDVAGLPIERLSEAMQHVGLKQLRFAMFAETTTEEMLAFANAINNSLPLLTAAVEQNPDGNELEIKDYLEDHGLERFINDIDAAINIVVLQIDWTHPTDGFEQRIRVAIIPFNLM